VQDAGCRMQGAGFRMQGSGCRLQGLRIFIKAGSYAWEGQLHPHPTTVVAGNFDQRDISSKCGSYRSLCAEQFLTAATNDWTDLIVANIYAKYSVGIYSINLHQVMFYNDLCDPAAWKFLLSPSIYHK